MSSMVKLQLTMVFAFAVSAWLLLFGIDEWIPSDPKPWWILKTPAYGLTIVGLIVSLGAIIISRTVDDTKKLWRTWWFHYMRQIYGQFFGGLTAYQQEQIAERNRSIEYSVVAGLVITDCKAAWLSFVAIAVWLLAVAPGLIMAVAIPVSLASGAPIITATNEGDMTSLSATVNIISWMLFAFPLLFLLRGVRVEESDWFILRTVVSILFGATLIIYLVIVPIQNSSLQEYMESVESLFMISLAIGMTSALLAGALYLLNIAGVLNLLAKTTVLGSLAGSVLRSAKDQTCVMIVSE